MTIETYSLTKFVKEHRGEKSTIKFIAEELNALNKTVVSNEELLRIVAGGVS